MSRFSARVIGWAWVCSLLLSATTCCSAEASNTFDAVPLLEQHAQHITTSDLSSAVSLHADILAQHNIRRESSALRQYVEQLQAVLQPDCCDYFTALPTVKGLTAALTDVLDLQLPAALRPVVRRSYVAAIWLLQRSRFFKWDTRALQKAALSGMYRLFDAHMDAAAGRAISFHHISKTGGTTLCTVAWENGCRGPSMSKKENCLLDTGSDSPVWVLRHNVTEGNRLTPLPPPPPAPPVMADPAAEAERLRLAAVTQRLLNKYSYNWWMYDCPAAPHLEGRVGKPCSERQERAVSKAATFFACENTLATEAGRPQTCEAFVNVVILRDALSQAVSLMTEVSLVYTRLLKQHRVLGWTPPKWDLAWWQQWAPLVVNSYAARTLLGSAAYCPAAPASAAAAAEPTSSSTYSSSSSGQRKLPWVLSPEDVERALHVLASFDLVLDLGSLALLDSSTTQLLGWSTQTYSEGKHQRSAKGVGAPTWEQLELLARQLPPPSPAEANASLPGGGSGTGAAGSAAATPSPQPQQAASSATTGSSGSAAAAADEAAKRDDELRRLIGEVRVRQVYNSHGLSHVLLPLAPEVPLLQPPAAVVGAALAALAVARQAPMSVENATDSTGASSHLIIKLSVQHQPGRQPAAPANSTSVTIPAGPAPTAAAATGAAPRAAAAQVVYRVWPHHGVVLSESQHQQLLQATAADARLYSVGRVLQAVDAAWLSVLGQQRKVRKLMQQVGEEAKSACGFAGLNHMQAK